MKILGVFVMAGKFVMGDSRQVCGWDDEYVHNVTLTRNFMMMKDAVTFEQYDQFCTERGYILKSDEGWGRGLRPVINVSWYEACEFADWLSEQHGFTKVYGGGPYDDSLTQNLDADGYRLPTEAEWEYAARGGHMNPHIAGDPSTDYLYAGTNQDPPTDYAWYEDNSGSQTHPVGEKLPNELGLCDMSGNVWEWCWDWCDWHQNYSMNSDVTDPTGPASGSYRLGRGGCWDNPVGDLRVSLRGLTTPGYQYNSIGLRLVRTVKLDPVISTKIDE